MNDEAKYDYLKIVFDSIKSIEDDTERLVRSDYELIGRLIQAFCIADFEARRLIASMRRIIGLPELEIGKLVDKSVIEHLEICSAEWTGDPAIADGVLKAATTLSMHQPIRNMFAHWAMRRVCGHEVYLFLSTSLNHKTPKNAREIETDEDGDAYFRLLPISEVQDELVKLEGHNRYLGTMSSRLWTLANDAPTAAS